MKAFDLSRAVCRQPRAECNKPKVALAIASARTVVTVERLANADRRHAATVDQWDADPWLLNTPGGVVDPRTGNPRPAVPTDYMTKMRQPHPVATAHLGCEIFGSRVRMRQASGPTISLRSFGPSAVAAGI